MSDIKIDGNNAVRINDILIDEKIFDEDKAGYRIIERENEIENLCRWIAETNNDNDRTLMIEDLKTLLTKTDKFCFSSTSTNEYLFPDDEEFENTCKEILELNEKIESKFFTIELDEDNKTDLQKWINDDKLIGLADDKAGGIIGYISRDHIEKLLKILG